MLLWQRHLGILWFEGIKLLRKRWGWLRTQLRMITLLARRCVGCVERLAAKLNLLSVAASAARASLRRKLPLTGCVPWLLRCANNQ